VRFSGTLQDPSAIGSTTGIAGTLTWLTSIVVERVEIVIPVTSCQGTTAFAGTINWTTLSITVPQITLDCGASPGITYTNVVLSLVKQQ
jgi:hypothetical protein